jgi:hypothetical protein
MTSTQASAPIKGIEDHLEEADPADEGDYADYADEQTCHALCAEISDATRDGMRYKANIERICKDLGKANIERSCKDLDMDPKLYTQGIPDVPIRKGDDIASLRQHRNQVQARQLFLANLLRGLENMQRKKNEQKLLWTPQSSKDIDQA